MRTDKATVLSSWIESLRHLLWTRLQSQADRYPADSAEDEIDGKEQAEDIETVDRPARDDHQADQQGDQAGEGHDTPRRSRLHVEGEHDLDDSRGDQRGTQ